MIEGDALRVGFAFSAGLATFFAPCAYPMLPGYVAFYLGDVDEEVPTGTRLRRAALVGGLAAAGFFVVFGALAGTVAAIGTSALRNIAVLGLGVGGLLVLLGSAMALGWVGTGALHVRLPKRRRTKSGFFLFGIGYAIAAAGCTAPVFVAIASVAFTAGPVGAFLTFLAYASGMALLIIAVTVLAGLGHDHLLRRLSATTGRITRVAGVLVVLAGLAQIYLFLFEFGGLAILGLA